MTASEEPFCLLCGRASPCMTESDLKPGDPGVPCTFDLTPQELADDNKRLRSLYRDCATQLRFALEEVGVRRAEVDALRKAAQAVVERWDTPLWKDVPATATCINVLRKTLERSSNV